MITKMRSAVVSALSVSVTSTIGGAVVLFAAPPFDGYAYCASQQEPCGSVGYKSCVTGYCKWYCDENYPEEPECIDQCVDGGMKWCS